MSDIRHPDIEIYIKNSSLDDICQWLEERGVSLTETKHHQHIHHFVWILKSTEIKVMINTHAVGKAWASLWFDSAETPWAVDLTCAQEASDTLKTQVRCIANSWQEGDEPDVWWKVEHGEATEMQWNTH